jgi:uncharacterized protein YbjT (DUF2867 family)
VDFTSKESLTGALKGIDAVVSTVAGVAVKNQETLVAAAAAAGVKRFIPSEYGSVTTNPKLKEFPMYDSMFRIREQLQEHARTGQMTWTVLACGAFLEFLFKAGAAGILDFKARQATLLDEGDNRLSATSLVTIGRAIAAILKHPNETKNRVVKVSEVIVTQNQVLQIAKSLRPGDSWKVNHLATSALLKDGLDSFAGGDYSFPSIRKSSSA